MELQLMVIQLSIYSNLKSCCFLLQNELKLIRARPIFQTVFFNPYQVSIEVFDRSQFTRRVVVSEVYHQTIKYQLTHQSVCYNFIGSIARICIIHSGQKQFFRKMFLTKLQSDELILQWKQIRNSRGKFKKSFSIVRYLVNENCSIK